MAVTTTNEGREDAYAMPAGGEPPGALAALVSAAQSFPLASSLRVGGRVSEIAQDLCVVEGLSISARVGDVVQLEECGNWVSGQIVQIRPSGVTVKPFKSLAPIKIGTRAWLAGSLTLSPHDDWKGRAINALGEPIDGRGPLPQGASARALDNMPPPALQRQRVLEPIRTGINVIDVFTPLCRGQRIGIFAGSGIGKSTLLQMLAGGPRFDTAVIALVGERGREVREFLEDGLGETVARAITVISTSDESPMLRRMAPMTAVTIAEHFRDAGEDVILIVDSITRFAHAARDAAMAAGEPPVSRGYTPSVFSDIARLLERSGPGTENAGTITGIFSVLVDGDDHDEPIADTIRGTLDGHIILERRIAEEGRYPAVDPLRSISRMASSSWTGEQQKLVLSLRTMISRYEETRDLRMLGSYSPGADPVADKAMEIVPRLYAAFQQAPGACAWDDPFQQLARELSNDAGRSSYPIALPAHRK
jgi:flagellum-specific ATP synthase